jgi:hypothetical protein
MGSTSSRLAGDSGEARLRVVRYGGVSTLCPGFAFRFGNRLNGCLIICMQADSLIFMVVECRQLARFAVLELSLTARLRTPVDTLSLLKYLYEV